MGRQTAAEAVAIVGQKLGTFIAKQNAKDLLVLNELIESGKVTTIIDRTYALGELPTPSKTSLEEQTGTRSNRRHCLSSPSASPKCRYTGDLRDLGCAHGSTARG